jgi:hypothetical protein
VSVGPCIPVGDHEEGRQVARRSDVATRSGGGATQRHSLSTRHPDVAPVAVEEDAKGRKVIVCKKGQGPRKRTAYFAAFAPGDFFHTGAAGETLPPPHEGTVNGSSTLGMLVEMLVRRTGARRADGRNNWLRT